MGSSAADVGPTGEPASGEGPKRTNLIQRSIDRFDRFQMRRRWLAFPMAVVKKFGDDRAGNLAALIAYYGFFSLFPLLLVLVAVLGFILRGNATLQESIVNSALAQFPIIGDQIKTNVKALSGSAGVALGIGTLVALWAGLGVTNAAQNAFNDVWGVPLTGRPDFLKTRLRSLVMLLVLGGLMIASTVLSGLGSASNVQLFGIRLTSLLISLVLNFVLYMLAFRLLVNAPLSWGDVLPGAILGAILWTALQYLGGYYVQRVVKHASAVYGFFGIVIGLLTWIYLAAQLTLYAAEVNVVLAQRL